MKIVASAAMGTFTGMTRNSGYEIGTATFEEAASKVALHRFQPTS